MDKTQSISGTGPKVIVSFVVALVAIAFATVTAIVLVALFVADTATSIVLIGAISTFATSIGASVVGMFSLLYQVRGEMNHRFDQLIEAKTNLSYNAGVDAAGVGDTGKRGTP